ncbi:MAG: chemotaxis protein CheW [Proteobacteria bacterium]|nr:chemotaxis protein CheW [Pseudomonadota bacterium]MBU1688263.1 chemotaxis protein CheW [Pseudomonadota bacterium]
MTTKNPDAPPLDFITFYLQEMLCGIELSQVESIHKLGEITQPYQAADYVMGLINLRGRIVTVLDLHRKLGFAISASTQESHVIIVRDGEEIIGLLVDRIGDAITVPVDSWEQPSVNIGGNQQNHFRGVCKMKHELIAILDLDEVLKPEQHSSGMTL